MGFFQNLRTSGILSAFDLEVPRSVVWSQPQCKNVVSLCLLTSPYGKLTICFCLSSVWLLKEVGRIARVCVCVCARAHTKERHRKREKDREREETKGESEKEAGKEPRFSVSWWDPSCRTVGP